jgi:AcrR family transcriptional regulator
MTVKPLPDPLNTGAVRDRETTRKRLIRAVGTILAQKGFTGLGVNAVARAAGVDKVLIYRYFGGLSELTTAYGREGNFWPTIEELAGGDVESFAQLPLDTKLKNLSRNFSRAIRQRPLTQEIMAWEMVERTQLTIELETIRENTMLRFFEMFFPSLQNQLDLHAITAIIGAAISYLACRARQIQWYNGVDLQAEEGWLRIERAIDTIVNGLLGLT